MNDYRFTQKDIFKSIERTLSKNELLMTLQQLFSLKKSAAYRIIDGTTQLPYNKMMALIQHLNIVIPGTAKNIGQGGAVWYTSSRSNEDFGVSFFRRIVGALANLSRRNSKIYYTTYEIPFFYYCYFPELLAFKIFCWYNTAWNTDLTSTNLFDFERIWRRRNWMS